MVQNIADKDIGKAEMACRRGVVERRIYKLTTLT
jgi:hypothetical protein